MQPKIWGILALGAALAAGASEAKDRGSVPRKLSSADDCLDAAGRHARSYLNDQETGGGKGLRLRLYQKFPGKNGYGEVVYTYLYRLTAGGGSPAGILRVTENHRCQYTTIGRYQDENDMDQDDREAAEDGAEEGS